MGGIFDKPSKPKVVEAPAPTVAATPPPPEERKGTSALRIDLNLGGGNMGGAGGTSGLSIPR